MYTVKWSVLQYVIIRPGELLSVLLPTRVLNMFVCRFHLVLSIVGIIAQAKGVLCESGSWSFKTAKAYISLFDAISIT